jgi:hypothetical protein
MSDTIKITAKPSPGLRNSGERFFQLCKNAVSNRMEAAQIKAEEKAPERTGRLGGRKGGESSIHYTVSANGKTIVGTLSATALNPETGEDYAEKVSKGTGLYGPYKARIFPRKAKMLAWMKDGSRNPVTAAGWKAAVAAKKVIFARSTRGQKPNPFMEKGMNESWEKAPAVFARIGIEFNRGEG